LIKQYLRFIDLVRPPLILLENVRGFKTMRVKNGAPLTYSDLVKDELSALGYDVWTSLLVASDWGVPQRRPRFFVVAIREGLARGVDPFLRLRVTRRAFLRAKGLPTDAPTSARMALADLEISGKSLVSCQDGGSAGFFQLEYEQPESLNPYCELMRRGAGAELDGLRLARHSIEVESRFREILATCAAGRHLSEEDRARFKSQKRSLTPLAADQPSCTITTLPDDVLHYSEPRILTVRECARLQSFPDWFSFRGPYTTGGPRRRNDCPRYTQVGNAVPPMMAEAIGAMLSSLLAQPRNVDAEALEVFNVPQEICA
jgi:DNA (cytosine-5)-methyltransferase 1